MRASAYFLLLLGSLWLTMGCCLPVGPLARAIATRDFASYPDTKQYSGAEVREAIVNALIEYRDSPRRVLVPAALMFAGGVLLDFASRRRLDPRRLTTRSSEQPPAGRSPP